MWPFQKLFSTFSLLCLPATGGDWPWPSCKATPNTNTWPNALEWNSLNQSLSGRLLQPPPPGAVCHPGQPTYNALACPAVQAGWLTSSFHADNPVSSIVNNWNNDTCLPVETDPCSGKGYPVYVVNATCAEDVKKGVDFAREHNVRLIVKGTGHDYLGRSSAPNSLSIWTRNMKGLSFHNGFTPKGCSFSIDIPAVTAAAGTQMLELDEQAQLVNLTIVGGGAETVGIGGYITGGGHSALSTAFGLAADQVLEIEMVTPGGDIITVNECQYTDLFWAMRGGGGSTFGVLTSVTLKAFPSFEFATTVVTIGSLAVTGTEEEFWDVMTNVLSQYPDLNDQGITCYSNIAPNYTLTAGNTTYQVNGYSAIFLLPLLSPFNSSDSLATAVSNMVSNVTAPYPLQFATTINSTTYPNFWLYFVENNGPLNGGVDMLLGSRLLDGNALTTNLTALKQAFQTATPPGSVTQVNLVAGKNVWDAHPRGGSDSVNPAWRRAYVHTILGVTWQPFDTAEETTLVNLLTNNYTEALRQLAPDMGAYINEADPCEPNFQQTFWGENYPRLLEIKRMIDPWDVFWCTPCVGNERWHVVDDVLCRI